MPIDLQHSDDNFSAKVMAAVERIAGSKPFVQSERLSRFLRFVVETTLAGRSAEIKELVIAAEVFDRGQDFDPKESTIVRTEARRLRQRLDEYYRGEGRDDAIQIRLPKGAYVPVFSMRNDGSRSALLSRRLPAWFRIATALALIAGGIFLAWYAWSSYGPLFPAEQASLVVLPFRDLSSDAKEAYLAFGVQEELTGDLRAISGMQLTGSGDPEANKSDNKTGGALNHSNSYALEGTVRRTANHVDLQVRVIEPRSGEVVMSDESSGDISTVARMCGSLALSIARGVRIRVSADERRRLAGRSTIPADAVLHFWRGLHSFQLNDSQSIADAIGHFEQAVAVSKQIDWAYAMLAVSYYELASRGRMDVAEAEKKADAAAGRAAALNYPAHCGTKGLVLGKLQWKWSAAGLELQRYVELNPNSVRAHAWYADHYLRPLGRTEEALAQIDKAVMLEPANRGLAVVRASILIEAGQADQVAAEFDKTMRPGPPFGQAHFVYARAKALLGDHGTALAIYEKTNRHLDAAWVHALAGRRKEAELSLAKRPPVESDGLMHLRAAVHAALGQDRLALDDLEKAFNSREVQLAYLKADPRFARLRPNPQFQSLIRKIGLISGRAPRP